MGIAIDITAEKAIIHIDLTRRGNNTQAADRPGEKNENSQAQSSRCKAKNSRIHRVCLPPQVQANRTRRRDAYRQVCMRHGASHEFYWIRP